MKERRNRRTRGERGATMVEAAIVTPVFVLLILGLLEFSFFFKDNLAVGNAVHDGAREASAVGRDGFADFAVLTVMRRSLTALDEGTLDFIVVYKGDQDEGRASKVPPACITEGARAAGGVKDLCNVYDRDTLLALGWFEGGAAWSDSKTQFNCMPPDTLLQDCDWPGTERNDAKLDDRGNGPPDFVGVYVQATHEHVAGIFRPTTTITDWAVVQIEPRRQK